MAKAKTTVTNVSKKRPIESYEHSDKQRANNPPVGLVTPDTDPDAGTKKSYEYDPHLDPQLQWAGKTEHRSFEVPTVSLHVHERIDPRTIIEAVKKKNGKKDEQLGLFDSERDVPLRDAVDFYKHPHGWSNRLIAGDSLLVMNSLLEKEGMGGKVQMIYIDPPYGITYKSNFQPFVNNRDVTDGKDEDLTSEPEQIRAFRDTWELGIHSYLTYLRDRLLLARELLSESGSVFVQISDENLHHVRELMDEAFGSSNFVGIIAVTKTAGGLTTANRLPTRLDYLVWYAKDLSKIRYHQLYYSRDSDIDAGYNQLLLVDGTIRTMSRAERSASVPLPVGSRVFRSDSLTKPGPGSKYQIEHEGKMYDSGNRWWGSPKESIVKLIEIGRVRSFGNTLRYLKFLDDFSLKPLGNLWDGLAGAKDIMYVVQTNEEIIRRCILMTTDPGDLVFDPTCGSGTTASVAEERGRRWITCDTSRVAVTLAKQRLMTALYDFFVLAQDAEGVGSGFKYKTVPHITLASIANNPDINEGMSREEIDETIAKNAPQETLYDQPLVDKSKTRVTGPFTVEAVPAPAVKSVEDVIDGQSPTTDISVVRSGETLRQEEWRDELYRAGVRGKAGQRIKFARLEPLPGCRWLHADGETKPNDDGADAIREPQVAYNAHRIVVSFGPDHAPLEQRQVAKAIEEAHTLVPRPTIILFAAFQFDPEAAKDIDETNWPGVTLLKVQMNADLLTDDLKKKRASNESFWLIGQPDVQLERITSGDNKGKLRVSVHGFDYYNTKTGDIESGGKEQIAVWMLDTDYDGRSIYPRQVFFPMSGPNDGWARLAKNLKAEIDEDLIEAYRGTESLPFEPGEHRRVAVKIVDDRGIESLKILEVE
ncbi:MAG: site-specific DNA-methyltransferase [Flavobacteriales bacterium]|nr:site-specific DNA-methyltransferase [Flavobacteriales bacterium]